MENNVWFKKIKIKTEEKIEDEKVQTKRPRMIYNFSEVDKEVNFFSVNSLMVSLMSNEDKILILSSNIRSLKLLLI